MPRPSPTPLSPSAFASSHLALLAQELAAETAATSALLSSHSPKRLEGAGLAVTGLVLGGGGRGLGVGGSTVVELVADAAIGSGGEMGGVEHFGVRVGDVVRVGQGGMVRGKGKGKDEMGVLELGRGGVGIVGVVVRVGGGVAVAVQGEGEGDGEGEGLDWGGRLWV